MVFKADGELVVALLVGNDQVNDVKLKNNLGADFFDAAEAEVQSTFGAGFGSLGLVGLQKILRLLPTGRSRM